MRINLNVIFIIAIASFLSIGTAQAQSIPIACDQYLKAVEACTKNAENFLERTDPKSAESLKEQIETFPAMEKSIRDQVALHGETEIAERCTKPEFVKGMINSIMTVMMPLTFARAVNDDCASAYSEIQVPTE